MWGCVRFSIHSDLKVFDSKRSTQTRDIRAPPTSGARWLALGWRTHQECKKRNAPLHPSTTTICYLHRRATRQFPQNQVVLYTTALATRRLTSLPLLYYVHGVSPSVPQWLPINFRTISSLVEKLLGNQMGAAWEHPPKSNNFRPWH